MVAKDPKVDRGKKPKGIERRLYTNENPKDPDSDKMATSADAKATLANINRSNNAYPGNN